MGTVGGVAGAPRPVHRGARRAAGVAGRPPVLPLAVRQSNARRLRPLPATQPDRDVRPAPPPADRTRRLRRVHRRGAEPGDPNGHRDREGRARSRPRRRHRLRPGPPRQWSTGGRVAAGLPGAARHGRVDRSTGNAGAVAHARKADRGTAGGPLSRRRPRRPRRPGPLPGRAGRGARLRLPGQPVPDAGRAVLDRPGASPPRDLLAEPARRRRARRGSSASTCCPTGDPG